MLQESRWVGNEGEIGNAAFTYSYARNNPISAFDPDGLAVICGAVYDPTMSCDMRGRAGMTCTKSRIGEPTPCRETPPPAGTCSSNNGSTFGFDITADISVNVSLDPNLKTEIDCLGRGPSAHEAAHLVISLKHLSGQSLNSSFTTEGLKSLSACNAARQTIRERIRKRTREVDDISDLVDLCALKTE